MRLVGLAVLCGVLCLDAVPPGDQLAVEAHEHWLAGRLPEAAAALSGCCAGAPSWGYAQLGLVLKRMGRLEQAVLLGGPAHSPESFGKAQAMRTGLALDPANPNLASNLAATLAGLSRPAQAAEVTFPHPGPNQTGAAAGTAARSADGQRDARDSRV